MFTRFESKGEFLVVGVEGSPVNGDETPVHHLVDNFIKHRRNEVRHALNETTEVGIGIQPAGGPFVYFYGREVTEIADVPEGMVGRTIPAQEYAVFTHHGSVETIREQTYGLIFGTWLPENGYEWDGSPLLEVFDERYIAEGPNVEQSEVDVYIPLKKKA